MADCGDGHGACGLSVYVQSFGHMHGSSWRSVDTVPYETKIRGFEPMPSC